MWTQEKTLELIDVIQCRPFLYDTEAKNYRNKKIVDNTWSDVDFAMKTPPGTSKEKYQLLRNAFRKTYLSGQKKKFPLYEKMEFLIPFLRPGNNPENSLQRCVERATAEYLKDNSEIFYSGDDESQLQIETNQEEEEIDEVEDYLLDSDSNHSEDIALSISETFSNSNEESQPKKRIVPKLQKMPSNEDSRISDTIIRLSFKKNALHPSRVIVPPIPRIEKKKEDEIELENPAEYLLDSNFNHSEDDQIVTKTLPKRKFESQPDSKFIPKKMKNEILEPTSSTTAPIHSIPVAPVTQQIYSPIQPTCDCSTDPDAIFLKSLLEDMKTMNRKNKGLFKIKVQQVLQDILYPDD